MLDPLTPQQLKVTIDISSSAVIQVECCHVIGIGLLQETAKYFKAHIKYGQKTTYDTQILMPSKYETFYFR